MILFAAGYLKSLQRTVNCLCVYGESEIASIFPSGISANTEVHGAITVITELGAVVGL
jgi:hypothetical protein